jgi:hypothetical protein
VANKYAVVSGLWSDNATWSDTDGGAGGASVPADNDAVFISAAVEVIMDVDLSSYTGLQTVTIRGGATPGELIWKDGAGPALRIGTTNTNVRTDRFSFNVADTFYSSPAIPAGTALSGSDVPQNTYGAWALDIGVDASIHITEATDNATGYGSGALAIVGLPAVAASHVRIGTVTAMKSDGVFDPGTTALDDANVTEAYANIAGATFSHGYLKIRTTYQLVGTTSTNRGRLLANSDGVWGNTGSLSFANKAVIALEGTAQILTLNLDMALYCYQPTLKYLRTYKTKYRVTGSASTDTLNLNSHGLANATAVCFTVAAGGSLPAPLEEDTLYWVVNTATNTFQVAYTSGGTAIDLTTDGTGDIDAYDGHTNLSAATINVLEDVSAATGWTATDEHDRVLLANYGPQDLDIQRTYLTTINSGSIVLAENINSVQAPGARIYLSSRNVSIRTTTTATTYIIDAGAGTHTNIFQCEIANTVATSTTYGYGPGSSTGSTFSSSVFSGTVFGLNRGLSANFSYILTGNILGCTNGTYATYSNNYSGSFIGCDAAVNSSTGFVFSGLAFGCSIVFSSTCYNIFTESPAILNGCRYPFSPVYKGLIKDTVIKNSARMGVSNEIEMIGGTLQGMLDWYSSNCRITFINTKINGFSSTWTSRAGRGSGGRVAFEGYLNVPNAHKIMDTYGDIIKTACDGTGDAPSVDPDGGNGDCIEISNTQTNIDSTGMKIFEHRIWATGGVSKTYTYKMQTTFTGLETADRIKLVGDYLNSATLTTMSSVEDNTGPATRDDDTDWSKTMAVTINPSQTGWITLTLVLYYHESGNEIYIWPTPTVS